MGRKRGAQWWGLWALVVGLGTAGGCGRSIHALETTQQRERLLRRAEAKEREGDREGALALLNDALDRNPRLTSAHLKAALLYDDYKKDYVRCVYHYQRYLELLPETEKRAMIEEAVRRARLLLAASYAGQPVGTDDRLETLQTENERLKRAVRQLREQAAGSAPGGHWEHGVPSDAGEPPAPLESGGAPGGGGSATAAVHRVREAVEAVTNRAPAARADGKTTPVEAGSGATCVVQPGDTLSAIAARVYRDRSQWKWIYDANRAVLPSPEKLRAGQTLRVPPLPGGAPSAVAGRP